MTQYTGTPGNDNLTGSPAADTLDGGAGADTMAGLAGNDVYMVDDPGDVVVEAAGAGTDRINATLSFSLPANVEDLWLVGVASTSGTGNGLDNVMWGNGAANVLTGLAGNDVLDGGAGADTLVGGSGDDTYWVDDAGDNVVELAGEGNDTVKSTLASYTLGAQVENLVLLPGAGNLQGTGNALDNVLTGNEGNNVLVGAAGNDTLDGGAGADAMSGGAGNDSYRVDDASDVVSEQSGEGSDTVTSTLANYTLPANVEDLNLGSSYSDTSALNGTGNALDNTLRGNSGANVLVGGGGNDMLVGGSGNDTLTGGTGNDVFYLSTTDTGTDTITDLESGDLIEVCGANFSGMVTVGNGATAQDGDVQVFSSGGQTILYIGLDAAPGADLQILLNGSHAAGNFQPHGFELVYDTNHAPTPNGALPAQQVTENTAFAFHLPANAFVDPDGDAITYSLSLFDIDWGYVALPAWLQFNAATGNLSGTPSHADIGMLTLIVSATDSHGATTDASFELSVQATPAPPRPAPTVSFSDDTPGVAPGPITFFLAFNEAVTGLTLDDFVVGNGTLSALSGSGSNYSVSVVPASGIEGPVELSLKAAAVSNDGGVTNALASAAPQPVDTRGPSVVDFAARHDAAGTDVKGDLVFLFSEAIRPGTGTVLLKDAAGATVEAFPVATSSHVFISGSVLALDPSANLAYSSTLSVEFAAGTVLDLLGNACAPQSGLSFTTQAAPDTTPPTLALASNKAGLASGESATLTILLSESATDFGANDITVSGGTLSNFSGSGSHYSATFNPAANSVTEAVISVASGRFTDAAGNANADGADADNTLHIRVDTQAPVALTFSPADEAADVLPRSEMSIGFSEAVQRGAGSVQLKTAAGAVVESFDAATSPRLSVNGNTLTVRPTLDLLGGTDYRLEVSSGSVKDLAGNAYGGTSAYNFAVAVHTLVGTALADHLIGTAGVDQLTALAGDDRLDGGQGNDRLDGGAGIDLAVFSAARQSATVLSTATGFAVTSTLDGADMLTDIERLQFADLNLALDLSGHAGSVARVLGAVFGPQFLTHKDHVGIGLDLLDRGATVTDLVAMALNTDAFVQLAGSRSNTDVVARLYTNVTGAAPSASDLAYFVDLLDRGIYTQVALAQFASETDANAVHIDLVGLASSGLEYVPPPPA